MTFGDAACSQVAVIDAEFVGKLSFSRVIAFHPTPQHSNSPHTDNYQLFKCENVLALGVTSSFARRVDSDGLDKMGGKANPEL